MKPISQKKFVTFPVKFFFTIVPNSEWRKMEMENEPEMIQTASLGFFVPIAAAYCLVCGSWAILYGLTRKFWVEEPEIQTNHRWWDLASILFAAAGVFALGEAYRRGLLLPGGEGLLGDFVASINLCIPYAPIFLTLLIRRQSLQTVWVSPGNLHWKLLAGCIASLVGVSVFVGLRSEWERVPHILSESISTKAWLHAPAVFLEALALAFVFVRMRWAFGMVLAIAVPSLLFAAGHVPSGIESGRTLTELVLFFAFNSLLAGFIFSVVMKSRDVIWIAIPHFFLDVAIGAFH